MLATVFGLFLFVGLGLLAYYSPNYLGEPKLAEPKADPAAKLSEVRAKNQAVLDGGKDTGVKKSLAEATAEVLGYAEKNHRLPFPVEKPPQPKTPEPKK